jgi:peptide methionine sulfoxide reductase msrA/msrB
MHLGTTTTRALIALVAVVAVAAVGLLVVSSRTKADAKSPAKENQMTFNKLSPEEERVIVHKGTELPFTGKYEHFSEAGTYTCKRCGAELFRSTDKFDAGCGWPAFDDAIPGAVTKSLDADGSRDEITCTRCGAHLGHLFEGERFTPKDARYCVNSISMNFTPASEASAPTGTQVSAATPAVKTETAYFAGGCFWGTEYFLQQAPGVVSAHVGYMGGHTQNPTYAEVCEHESGHAEAVEVVFDPSKTSYEALAKYFFEIHDPTQLNHQGPDYGDQYRSEVFYTSDAQKTTTEKLIGILKEKGYGVVTKVTKAGPFYVAENYHQNYYKNNGHEPYCHIYTKRF